MGFDIDLLILIAVVAISITSSIKKKKGKKSPAKPEPSIEDDPWASIRSLFDGTEEEDQQPKPDISVYENIEEHQTSKSPHNLKEQYEVRAEKKQAKSKKTIEQVPTTTEVQSDVLDDFDLRTAIIYSEILKPKFND